MSDYAVLLRISSFQSVPKSHLKVRGAPLQPQAGVEFRDAPQINQAAIALIRSWREEDIEQQRKDWEALKQAIDEDRSSDRKLFS